MIYNIIISIHALREESDLSVLLAVLWQNLFQSTLSVRRATQISYKYHKEYKTISIHALREESDFL